MTSRALPGQEMARCPSALMRLLSGSAVRGVHLELSTRSFEERSAQHTAEVTSWPTKEKRKPAFPTVGREVGIASLDAGLSQE